MNAQLITSVRDNAAYVGRVLALAFLLFILVLFSLTAFSISLDALWQQNSDRAVSGAFLGLVMLYIARVFWKKLLRSL